VSENQYFLQGSRDFGVAATAQQDRFLAMVKISHRRINKNGKTVKQQDDSIDCDDSQFE